MHQILNYMENAEKLKSEMFRYLPVLERAEADPEIWDKLTAGLGIATLNGYREACERLRRDPV